MTLDEAIRELRTRSRETSARLPSAEEVSAMERELGAAFHPDYRRFLLEASDVDVGFYDPATITDPASWRHLPSVLEDARQMGVPVDLFPFLEDNSNFYCFAQDGTIRYWAHDGDTSESWPSLANWIESEWLAS